MTSTNMSLQRLGLRYNPFPPATTGVAFIEDVSLPTSWETGLRQCLDSMTNAVGDKALVIVGGYGTGKTFILRWIADKELPPRRIQPYFFDNPGVAFYDLANRLLRQVGRYELSKALWEMLYRSQIGHGLQPHLVPLEFPDWLAALRDKEARRTAMQTLSSAILDSGLATDEEIAYRFARVVVDTRERPFYEYRDFVPRSPSTLVAEREEANYFRTLVRVLVRIQEADGIGFLIDEFEDVALSRRLNKKQITEYIATMRRLLDTAREENLWIILSMTPEGYDQTSKFDPSLVQRFTQRYDIPPLSDHEAYQLIEGRLRAARRQPEDGLSPFADHVITKLRPTTRSSPRRLIKVFWQALALGMEAGDNPPIPGETVRRAEEILYPGVER